jgi:hypothetical protein
MVNGQILGSAAREAQVATALEESEPLGAGEVAEDDLDLYLRDLTNQAGNLRLLLASVEADLAVRIQERLAAQSIEGWLLSLRSRVEEVEADTEEAFSKRRELVKLLVKSIITGRGEQGRPRVEITYRFGEPPTGQGMYVDSVDEP